MSLLRKSKLVKYHSMLLELCSDMNAITESVNYDHTDFVIDEQFYNDLMDILERFITILSDAIFDRTYRNSYQAFHVTEATPEPEEQKGE